MTLIFKPLISPESLIKELPASEPMARFVSTTREQISNIIQGNDDRLLIIVGPCSVHDVDAALEYASHLKKAAIQFADDLVVVMRVYFEKPRTTIGWKGLINDPNLDRTLDANEGLPLARKLLLNINELRLPAGTEFLDTIIPHYLHDLISWGAIGARTAESQLHRELASGLPMPIGFKNTTDGNVKIAIDAVNTARSSHRYLSIDAKGYSSIVSTIGNPHCHIVLRGSHDQPNYLPQNVQEAVIGLKQSHLTPKLMIDCSHGNSMKNYAQQTHVARSIADHVTQGNEAICGVMIESNLIEGNQILQANTPLKYGQSITDGCISWKETATLLEILALSAKKRKSLKQNLNTEITPTRNGMISA